MNQTIVVEYRIRKDYCRCCQQKLPNPQTSEIREFEFNEELLMDWDDWNQIVKYEDELLGIIEECVYETLYFFTSSSDDKILIENSEFEKVKGFILKMTAKEDKPNE